MYKLFLTSAGKISAEQAELHAETELEKYRIIRDRLFVSDFDKYLSELEERTKKYIRKQIIKNLKALSHRAEIASFNIYKALPRNKSSAVAAFLYITERMMK